jgi:putative MFS transporter
MVKKFNATPTVAIFYAMCFFVVQFVHSYVGTGLSDLIGRRPAGILGALIMIGCTVVASRTESFETFLVFGAIMIGMLGWLWGVGDTYLSEFFRTSLRATGFGIMVGGGRVASIVAPYLVGWGIAHYGPTIPFLATSGLWVLTIIGYLIGPETSGKELEEVQL